MKRKVVLIFAIISVFVFNVFYVSGENIDLPDITTVVDGEYKKADDDSLPDFSSVIEKTTGSGSIVPVLPDVDKTEINADGYKAEIEELGKAKAKNIIIEKGFKKTVFSEILIGGGYPFLFHGDYSVLSASPENPFKILFNFNTANGYGACSFSDNCSDRNINLSFERRFHKVSNIKWGYFTQYNSISNGLQKQSDVISAINQDSLLGKGGIEYKYNNSLLFGAILDLDFYNRFGNISSKDDFPDWLKGNFIFSLNPEIYGNWIVSDNIKTEFSLSYLGAFGSKKSIENGFNNRGEIFGKVQWNKDLLQCYGGLGIVFGNSFNNCGVVLPFNLGINFSFPVYFSNRKVNIMTEGGLKSYYNSVRDLENKYRFAAVESVPNETSLWYYKFVADVPIKSSFAVKAEIDYEKTAFNNGVLSPSYDEVDFYQGLYKINQKEQELLVTDLNVTYHYKLFSIKFGIHSNWFDIPDLEAIQMLKLNIGFQDENSKWGASLWGLYKIDELSSSPVISIDGFFQVSETLRLTASINDIVPLFEDGKRIYAGRYIDRGFSASLLFNFVL